MGRTMSVSSVADTSPPMTTVASGFCTSAPADVDMAMGKKPSEAAVAVIMTGRSRVRMPLVTRCMISDLPSCSNLLNSDIRTMPLSTAMPKRAINPTSVY